jgi:hypothetical protein
LVSVARRSPPPRTELEYLLMLTRDLGYADHDVVHSHINEAVEVQRMLFALRRKVDAAS